jgi:hypothetical protein
MFLSSRSVFCGCQRIPYTRMMAEPKRRLNVQEFPRPPLLEKTSRHLQIKWAGKLIAETRDAFWVLETHHPPSQLHLKTEIPGILVMLTAAHSLLPPALGFEGNIVDNTSQDVL